MTAPVLILGAGINGAAIARELVLQGVPVCVVDTADMACGATAYSSRLIHGGLRYLEYGEFDLVRESLAERTRLLRLAPHLVRPLKLYIPVENRWGGFFSAAARFLRWPQRRKPAGHRPRGVWLVRAGLWMYDAYARDPSLPRRGSARVGQAGTPPVNAARFRWLCSYYDAQVVFPERFVVSLFDDARAAAAQAGVPFELWTYHRASLEGRTVRIAPVAAAADVVRSFAPAAIVNATGAWVDHTLGALGVAAPRLMGGTKGSHLVTRHAGLRAALGNDGLYAEAADGRPVFVLPFGHATLVGTTDLPYTGDPADAVATAEEQSYLLDTVNGLFPDVGLRPADVLLHYSGVRPLPFSGPATPASITRRHWLEENRSCAVPLYSVIGGKLTTCRSLAEESVDTLLARLHVRRREQTRERALPGGAGFPVGDAEFARWRDALATEVRCTPEQVAAVAALCGTAAGDALRAIAPGPLDNLPGSSIPRAFARGLIDREWVARLEDLVERRLMLLYEADLSRSCLRELAGLLVAAGKLSAADVPAVVDRVVGRLHEHFGRIVSDG